MSSDGIPGLAEKLEHLFTTVPAPTKSGVYSNDSAAAALEALGVTVSGVHLSHLRSGRRDNPSARLLAALAELFGVPYSYFFDSATEDKINAELDALAAIRNSRAKSMMLRVQSVSPKSLEFLETTLEHLLEIEGRDGNGKKPRRKSNDESEE